MFHERGDKEEIVVNSIVEKHHIDKMFYVLYTRNTNLDIQDSSFLSPEAGETNLHFICAMAILVDYFGIDIGMFSCYDKEADELDCLTKYYDWKPSDTLTVYEIKACRKVLGALYEGYPLIACYMDNSGMGLYKSFIDIQERERIRCNIGNNTQPFYRAFFRDRDNMYPRANFFTKDTQEWITEEFLTMARGHSLLFPMYSVLVCTANIQPITKIALLIPIFEHMDRNIRLPYV
jgi:hypothetical protein